jgi:hypothetical protein
VTPLEAAHEHAARGTAVFPVWHAEGDRCGCRAYDCTSPGKHPIGSCAPNGLKDATTAPAIIRRWWGLFPRANIATPTGAVLDVDAGKGGRETLAALEAQHGPLPVTPKVLTGGGGEHYHFAPVPRLRNSAGKVGPGLDIRGEGGYVLLPPSNHVSGGTYLEDVMAPLYETPLAPMPAWLVALAMAPTSGNGAGPAEATDWGGLLQGAPEGGRHAAAVRIAGHYLGKGLPAAEVEEILLGYAGRCTPPHDPADVRRIVRDLAAKDAGRAPATPEAAPTLTAVGAGDFVAQTDSEPERYIEGSAARTRRTRPGGCSRRRSAWRWRCRCAVASPSRPVAACSSSRKRTRRDGRGVGCGPSCAARGSTRRHPRCRRT